MTPTTLPLHDWQALFDVAPVPLFVVELTGALISTNRAARALPAEVAQAVVASGLPPRLTFAERTFALRESLASWCGRTVRLVLCEDVTRDCVERERA